MQSYLEPGLTMFDVSLNLITQNETLEISILFTSYLIGLRSAQEEKLILTNFQQKGDR